ncbi:MAG: sialidase family protein [Pirellulales bacterium]
MQIVARGTIYDATDAPPHERIAYFTALSPLRSGAMLCSFQLGPGKHSPHSTIGLCRSDDRGDSWQRQPYEFRRVIDGAPGSLAGAELVEVEPGRLLLFATWYDRSDPDRPLFDPVTEGILRGKQLYAVSSDEGRTWSDWQEIATPGLTGRATTGPLVQWPDGTIAYCFESFKDYDDPRPSRHAAWMLVSRDGGRTFSQPLRVAKHPDDKIYYWDQRLTPGRRPAEFVALFWTHDLPNQRDLRVHIARGKVTPAAVAGVETMSIEVETPRETTIPGQIAAPLLHGNRLLAFVVDRARPGTMRLWSSSDDGATWPEGGCLTIHTHEERAALSQGQENIDFKQYWEDMGKWSFGHPALRRWDDQHVLAAWYAGTPQTMSIHWARVRVE